jgi:acyl-ACP thioesterase
MKSQLQNQQKPFVDQKQSPALKPNQYRRKDFMFFIEVQPRFHDVDIFDHVNGGNFCDYMEEVIAQFRRKLKY